MSRRGRGEEGLHGSVPGPRLRSTSAAVFFLVPHLYLTSCSRTSLETFAGSDDVPAPTDAGEVPDAADIADAGDLDDAPPDAPPPEGGCFGAGETVLAPDEEWPTSIAIDATHVYWALDGIGCDGGRIRAMPKAGGPIVTLASDQPNPRALAVDQERVYFYDGCGTGLLRSVPKRGGAVLDHALVVGDSDARVIALDSQNIYFNDVGVLSTPKSGGSPVEIDNQNFVYALAADDGGVYWTGLLGNTTPYAVFAYHQGDAAPTFLGSPSDASQGIAIDAETIFFTSNDGIQRIPREGGSFSTFIDAPAWRLAVDEEFVYWTDGFAADDHSVNKMPKAGGDKTVLATGKGGYVALAVDDHCVYWASMYGAFVGRAPK